MKLTEDERSFHEEHDAMIFDRSLKILLNTYNTEQEKLKTK